MEEKNITLDSFFTIQEKGNKEDKYKVAFKFNDGKEVVIGQMDGTGEFALYLKPLPGASIEFNDGENKFVLYLEKIVN